MRIPSRPSKPRSNEAALTTHRNGEHFKKFQAATANMVTGRNVRAMSLIAFNAKGH